MELVAFLTARLDEDEAGAYATLEPPPGQWSNEWWADELRRHAKRLLTEVTTKRRILALHSEGSTAHACERRESWALVNEWVRVKPYSIFDDVPGGYFETREVRSLQPCDTLLALAQPYVDHPDFDLAWRQ